MNAIHRTYPGPSQDPAEGATSGGSKKSCATCSVKGHEKEEIMLYCADHKVTICAGCVVSTHKKCNNIRLSEAASRHKENIEHLSQNVNSYIKELKKLMEETNANFGDFMTQANKMKSEIKLSAKALKTKIDEEEKQLLNEVDKLIKEAGEKSVKSTQTSQETVVVKLLSEATDAAKSDDLALLPVHDTELREEWRKLRAVQIPAVRLTCGVARKNNEGALLGKIQIHNQRKQVHHGQPAERKGNVGDIPVLGNFICSILVIDSNILLIQNCTPEISVYSADKKLITKTNVPGLKNPWAGMICLGHDQSAVQLVLGDYGNDALHFITLTRPDWTIQGHRKQNLDFKPIRMALDNTRRQLVVIEAFAERLHIFSTQGQNIGTVQMVKKAIAGPVDAVKLGSMFVVADYTNSQVLWIDTNGKVQVTYKGPDHQPLQYPHTLAVDDVQGHVLVGDLTARCIHEIDEHGKFVRIVLQEQDGLQKPDCIHLAENGLLYTAYTCQRSECSILITEYRSPSTGGDLNVLETSLSARLTLNQY